MNLLRFYQVITSRATSKFWVKGNRYVKDLLPLFCVNLGVPESVSMHHTWAVSEKSKESIRSPETGVTGGLEPPRKCWKLNPAPERSVNTVLRRAPSPASTVNEMPRNEGNRAGEHQRR